MMRAKRGDDGGAALILVLVIVTVLSLGLAALLSFSDTSLRTTVALRAQGVSVYNADGATQAAVNNIRNSTYNGTGNCFGGGNSLNVPYANGAATVTCTPDPAKVLIQCPSLSQCNRPGNAILTIGTKPGEDGVNIQQPTGSSLNVHGIIFSNSLNSGASGKAINVVNGTLQSNTRVYARGACAGAITSVPSPASCNYGATANSLGNDPGYMPDASTAPAHQSLPACTTPNSVVTFSPGYYDDAYGLSQMMAGNSGCKGSTWWFKPGSYYFDFHNTGTNANPLLNTSGGNVWTINDGCLIAGTPATANGQPAACKPIGSNSPIPGSCVNPINTATAVGVQFVFGNDSQFAVKAGQAEICGTYNISKPPVAVYGLTAGAETAANLTGANSLQLTSVPTPGDFKATATVANLANTDTTNFASWQAAKKNDSGTMTVAGFLAPSAIPVGSVLQSAVVKVVHRHSDAATRDPITVTVTPTGGSAIPGQTSTGLLGSASFATESIPVELTRTGSLAQAIYNGTYTGAQIALTDNLTANNDVENIDSVRLEISYIPPAYRAGAGCVTNYPYTGTGSASICALVTSVNNSGNQFYVQGTTYAPMAALDLTLNNAAEQVFRFGVIARTLWIKETGSFSYTGPVIEVPDDSPGFVFGVYLNTYVCQTAPCSTSGPPNLKAKVAFVDADPTTPTAGQRQVVVESWSALR